MTADQRPKRQRLNADVRRAQLEDAAVELVGRVGYLATPADAIARLAGVSKGLLWHYFDDYDHLMAAAARRAFAVLSAAVTDDLDRSVPVPDLMRKAIRRAAQLPRTHAAQLKAIRQIAMNLHHPDGSLQLGPTEYDQLYEAQESLIRSAQQRGELRSDLDPRLLAVTYQGAIDNMIDYISRSPQVDVEAHAALVADVILDGITPKGR